MAWQSILVAIERSLNRSHSNPQRMPVDPFFVLSLDLFCINTLDGHFHRVNPAFIAKKGHSAEFLIAIGEKAESTHAIRIVPSAVDYWITTTYARERLFRKWWLREHRQVPLIQAYEELAAQYQ